MSKRLLTKPEAVAAYRKAIMSTSIYRHASDYMRVNNWYMLYVYVFMPLIYMSLNKNNVYCVMPRPSQPPNTCKWGGAKWRGSLQLSLTGLNELPGLEPYVREKSFGIVTSAQPHTSLCIYIWGFIIQCITTKYGAVRKFFPSVQPVFMLVKVFNE